VGFGLVVLVLFERAHQVIVRYPARQHHSGHDAANTEKAFMVETPLLV
jgi:hypothetical protein